MAYKPQKLTLAGVKKAAREYHAMGKLTAQNAISEDRLCVYQMGDCRCAIGAGLDPKTLAKIEEKENEQEIGGGIPIDGLYDLKIIVVDDIELNAMVNIQRAHDDWCNTTEENRPYKEKKFLALIEG